MKQLAVLLCLSLFASVSFAQQGTTLEEYRYLSKGYAYQKQMGLDASKAGYQILPMQSASNNVELVGLFRNGQQQPQALLLIFPNDNADPVYLCLPNREANQRVMNLFDIDRKAIAKQLNQAQYEQAMREFLFASWQAPSATPQQQLTAKTPTDYASKVDTDNSEVFTSRGVPETRLSTSTAPAPSLQSEGDPMPMPKVKTSSSVSLMGELEYRNALSLPEPQVASRKSGTINIKVCVNMAGEVTSTKFTQLGSTTFDPYLKKLALDSAKKAKFTKNDVREQCGIISYRFNEK